MYNGLVTGPYEQVQSNHVLVSEMNLRMIRHAVCWYLCVSLTIQMSMLSQKNSGHQEVQLAFKSIS